MRLLFLIIIGFYANILCAQQFTTVSNSAGMELIGTFAENREMFSSFACMGSVTVLSVTSTDEIYTRATKFAVLESQKERSSRSIYEIHDFSNLAQASQVADIFTIKGKRILGGSLAHQRFNDDDYDYVQDIVRMNWLPSDPWSWSYISCASLNQHREDALLWMESFREERLLWVEENGRLIRAEWDIGPEARIQTYFDSNQGSMPIYCRYIIPLNRQERFSKKSRLLLNQIETRWAEHMDGWVPVKVRNYRESLDPKGKIRSTETWDFSVDWNTKLIKEGVLDNSVFEVGKLSPSQIYDSFSKGTSPRID